MEEGEMVGRQTTSSVCHICPSIWTVPNSDEQQSPISKMSCYKDSVYIKVVKSLARALISLLPARLSPLLPY